MAQALAQGPPVGPGLREQAPGRLRAVEETRVLELAPLQALVLQVELRPARVHQLAWVLPRELARAHQPVLALPQELAQAHLPVSVRPQALVRVHQPELARLLAQEPVQARAPFERPRPEQRVELAERARLARRAARMAPAVPVLPAQQAVLRAIHPVRRARAAATAPAQWAVAARPAVHKPRKSDAGASIVA